MKRLMQSEKREFVVVEISLFTMVIFFLKIMIETILGFMFWKFMQAWWKKRYEKKWEELWGESDPKSDP